MPELTTTLRIPNYASAPSGLSGQLYFNSTDKQFYYHDGTNWIMLGLASSSGNVSNSGVPTAGQIALWTDATHIQGVADTTKQWDGGATGLTAATGRASLGGTTVGQSLFTLANPSAITFPKIQVGNTVVAESAATHLTSIGASNTGADILTRAGPGATSWIKASALGTIAYEDAATTRTSLGGTTVGQSFFTLTNPAAITFPKISAANAVTAEDAATHRTSLGLGTAATQASSAFEVPLTFSNTVRRTTNTIDLVGDSSAPGNSQYYGTNASGTKGWYASDPPTKVIWLVSGTSYVPSSGVVALHVECMAGGGGGGGAKASAGAATTGGGGGGGGYAAVYITGTIKGSYVIAVGAGGTAGAATPTDGGVGGSTSFDSPSVCTATGGNGGGNSSTGSTIATFAGLAGASGFASVGSGLGQGGYGEAGLILSAGICRGGQGGSSRWAGSATGAVNGAAGVTGRVYGGGGSGAASNSATGFAGGVGGAGMIRITEFF